LTESREGRAGRLTEETIICPSEKRKHISGEGGGGEGLFPVVMMRAKEKKPDYRGRIAPGGGGEV